MILEAGTQELGANLASAFMLCVQWQKDKREPAYFDSHQIHSQ